MPIQRHFIDWNVPLLPSVADYLIERYAVGDQLDLRKVVLVFTGRRASRRMLELLLEKASAQWPAFVPPRMVTFDQFPEMLYVQQRRLADDLTQLLVWKKALSSIPVRELSAALPRIPDDKAVPSWLSLCDSLRRQHNELAEEGMEFDEVSDALHRMGNLAEAERWLALRRIQSEYLMQMDALPLWDREAARLVAVQQAECTADFDILLIGTVDMSRVVRQMLDQVADRVTAIVHAPESHAAMLDEHGCLIPDEWMNVHLDIPLVDTLIADDPDEQATLAIHEIAALNGKHAADEISIGVANEDLVPPILQRLSDAGVSGRWPIAMQLCDTRPFRLLNGVVRHLTSARAGQPPDFATLSDLLRHPDINVWVDRCLKQSGTTPSAADWLTELDRYIAQHLQTSPGELLGSRTLRELIGGILKAVEQLLSHLCMEPPGQDVRIPESRSVRSKISPGQLQLSFDDAEESQAASLHRKLSSARSIHVWGNGILKLLATVYQTHELQPDSVRDRGITECCDRLADTMESLRQIPDSVMPACDAAQAIQLLLGQISDLSIPPEAGDQTIDLLGWLELPMDDSPVLILTGFNEGFVPESVTSDVFLPNSLRSRLGLRDNRRRYARDAYALLAMSHCREKIVYITGRKDGKGNPLMPSRLWFAADPDTLPGRVKCFYDGESSLAEVNRRRPSLTTAVSEPVRQQRQRLSAFAIPRPPFVSPVPEEISVTAFRDYLACPYRYFLKRELKLNSIEDETLELSASAFGSLIHDVLNNFGKSAITHATRPEPIEEYLLRTLHHLANLKFGPQRSATVAVQLQILENRLSAFATWQAEHSAYGWRIEHSEVALTYPDFRDCHGRNVPLTGRVDRIDRHQRTGNYRVLDYKTSERPEKPERTHQSSHEWVDLQLPLYRLLVKSLGIEQNVELGYIHLPGDLSAVGLSVADWSAEDLESAEQTARHVAADILDLKIDRITPGQEKRSSEFARVCQDTVIEQNSAWLSEWPGRRI